MPRYNTSSNRTAAILLRCFTLPSMSHLIISAIVLTQSDRIVVTSASNDLRPLEYHTREIESLTALYRTRGMEALEEELLWLFFQGIWQGDTRFDRAVAKFKDTEKVDSYAEYLRCHEDDAYRVRLSFIRRI